MSIARSGGRRVGTAKIAATSEQPVVGAEHERLRTATITSYAVDGLERFESELSEGLPADPDTAKAAALRRIQRLDDALRLSIVGIFAVVPSGGGSADARLPYAVDDALLQRAAGDLWAIAAFQGDV